MAYLKGMRRVWSKESSFASKANAELVQDEIDALARQDENGKCTNRALVDFAASHPESESHKCFNWDDTEAADRYRLQQAAKIKCEIMIVYEYPKTVQGRTPADDQTTLIKIVTNANHALPTKGTGTKNIITVLQSQEDTSALEESMKASIVSFVSSFKRRFQLAPSFERYYPEILKLLAIEP